MDERASSAANSDPKNGPKNDPKNDHGALLRRALRAVEEMKQKLDAVEGRARQPIAIVGMGCRFPGGVDDPASFWELLREGREAISEIPADRWRIDDYYDPDATKPGKMVSRFGGFLDSIDTFDAAFFGIAPREAAMMDPQQRMLLEVSWQALESGGIAPRTLAGSRTGVYLGMASSDYGQMQLHAGDARLLDVHYASGNGHSIASGRLSYLLGLRGPSVTLDTACSSSLVAVHLACQALRVGECELAMAGGVNVILAPETTVALSQAHMLASDGRSKAFDARADGFARAEGCGVVVLKTLARAEADGDRIFAVIRGSAVNQDGASSSLTAPNGPAQEELMRRALADAGKTAGEIGFVEAHGTGTALGDPIELRALGAVYGAGRGPDDRLLVGSLKTNFGHMEAAAGVGGLIKLALALEAGAVPRNLHFETPTPHVPWEKLRLAVPAVTTNWPVTVGKAGTAGKARVGAVSSFGFSGTNAHLIVEQGPVVAAASLAEEDVPRLLPISAKSEAALRALAGRYEGWLGEDGLSSTLAEIAATAGVGRDHFRHRTAVVASNRGEARAALARAIEEPGFGLAAAMPGLVFLFTGQGSEHAGMGLELLTRSGVFRGAVGRLEAALGDELGTGFAAIWANRNGELERAGLVQPALYAYGWALSEVWRSWGVTPRVVLGHSLGEYVAATVAGVMTPEEGVRLVAARGRLTDQLGEPGGMVAVAASEEAVREMLGDSLSVAALNGPASVVVSGALDSLDLLEERLRREGRRHKRLRTTHGFHSAGLDGMLEAFEGEAGKIRFKVPEVRWVSNLTGRAVERDKPVDAGYWRRHLRETVRFEAGLEAAQTAGAGVFLEVGSEPQLLALAEANGIESERRVARGGGGDWEKLLRAAGRLYCLGVDLDWEGLVEGRVGRRAGLPGYPFERRRFWFTDGRRVGQPGITAEAGAAETGMDREGSGHPLLGARLRVRGGQAIFHAELAAGRPEHLGDHVVGGRRILPGAAYLEMAVAAGRLMDAERVWSAVEVEFREVCVFDEPRLLETVVHAAEDASGRRRFEIASTDLVGGGAWTLHATGVLSGESFGALGSGAFEPVVRAGALGLRGRAVRILEAEGLYRRMSLAGAEFGPAFRSLTGAWIGEGQSLVELALLPEVAAECGRYGVHPVALDACLQAAVVLLGAGEPDGLDVAMLPVRVDALRVLGDAAGLRFATATVRLRSARSLTVDVCGLDEKGLCLVEVEGLTLVQAPVLEQESGWLHEVVWERVSLGEPEGRRGARRTLIVTGDGGHGQAEFAGSLAEAARADGATVTVVSAAVEDRLALLEGFEDSGTAEIFYLPGVEVEAVGAEGSGRALLDWQESVLGGALRWTQALAGADLLGRCRLWLISRGAAGPDVAAAEGGTLAGFARSVRCEYPGAEVVAVDVGAGEEDAERLWRLGDASAALGAQFALRGTSAWRPKLVRREFALANGGGPSETLAAAAADAMETRRLHFPGSGVLEDLSLVSEGRRVPGAAEIEIEIAAAAVNFHEVLSALTPGHGESFEPGGECAGVVARVGADVTEPGVMNLRVGDAVVAIGSGLMADFATLGRERVWKKPAGIGMEDAATLLVPFLTARWSLETVAQVRAGDWVLIHAGAGGVGLAAIQEARRLGARVLATAGNEAKRAYLLALGVEAVFDSRTAAFERGVMQATGGRGVDVVLNSLAGEKIAAGLRVLVAGGRFVELGERTVLSESEVRALRADVWYEVVQLRGNLAAAAPEIRAVIGSVLEDVAAGLLKPLPWRRFGLEEAAEAFRVMAAGQHTGRVLLAPRGAAADGSMGSGSMSKGSMGKMVRFAGFRRDGAYVVSGGLAGLGLLVVEWMAREGAGCVLALGRSEPSDEAKERVEILKAAGTVVICARCDVSDEAALAEALGAVPAEFALRGVFHCAGVWENATLPNQTVERYRAVLAAKAAGAWNLHRLTLSAALDCFVLFSSVAGVLGSRGQSNYAAANGYLDALARFRRERLGLTALSIDWGTWSGSGAAVRHGVVELSERGGVTSIAPERGLALLGRLMREDCAQVVVSRVDWKRWAEQFPAEFAANADLLGGLMPAAVGDAHRRARAATTAKRLSWRAELMAAPEAQRKARLAARVEERVRGVLSLGARQRIDAARPLQEYGLDSLLAIELRNALSADLETKLSTTTLFDYPTMGGLTDWLFADVLKAGGAARREDGPAERGTHDVVSGVSELSDEEVERLFLEKMAGRAE